MKLFFLGFSSKLYAYIYTHTQVFIKFGLRYVNKIYFEAKISSFRQRFIFSLHLGHGARKKERFRYVNDF